MKNKRLEGAVQPGINWWRFTIRIPGIHVPNSWPESIQGGLMTLATTAAAAPLFMNAFALPFEYAWALSALPLFWYYISAWLFGEPFAPGWITPSIPLVLVFLGGYTAGVEAIQAMTALALTVSALFLIFAVTGLGSKFFNWVPVELRAGIILGSAIAAFNGEFVRHATMPITLSVVWGVVFVLMFSLWVSKAKETNRALRLAANMAMLLGFVVAGLVGPLAGEVKFAFSPQLIFVPQFAAAIKAVHPLSIGWPSFSMFVSAFPLAVMVYLIVFGDLVLANTLLAEAERVRPDEKIIIDTTRSHYSLFFRNILQVITVGPLIPMHGPIWTGVTVFLVEQYKQGRQRMDSIYSGILSWYWPAFILVFMSPVVDFMKPILPVALSITLILTGFACAYIAMRMVSTPTSQGYALFIALLITKFGPAWGLAVGIGLFFLLLVQRKPIMSIPYDIDLKD